MPSLLNKALLLALQVDLAQNNVRRNVLSIKAGLQASSNSFVEQSVVVGVSGNFTSPIISGNVGTVVRVVGGLLNVTAINSLNTMQFPVNSLWVYTGNLTSLVFVNPSATIPVQLFIVQA